MENDKRNGTITTGEEGRLFDKRGTSTIGIMGKGSDVMYRPTVRYADVYKEYVDKLFRATALDRNQIIRLALFTAAHSKEFNDVLTMYKRTNVSLPKPMWGSGDHHLWMAANPDTEEGGEEERIVIKGNGQGFSLNLADVPLFR